MMLPWTKSSHLRFKRDSPGELSEIILSQEANHYNIHCYVQTSTELAFALKKHQKQVDLQPLLQQVRQRLLQESMSQPLAPLVKPLNDVVNTDIEATDQSMQWLFPIHHSNQVLH